ncbi:Pyruvate/Phosphoenolpyruvate kinase-like domain-containing protein [Aspergillus tetrazonus]
MQAANRLQKALKAGSPAFGAWQMLPGTNLTRTICPAACGTSPMVRVAEGKHWMIKRALDAGAHGIMVPMIESVVDARTVVEYSKFPPLGKRGFEALLAVDKLVSTATDGQIRQLTGLEYLQQADEGLNIEAIAAIDGIDVLFTGSFDISVNMGFVGVYCDTGAQGKAYAERGFQMISVVTDMVGLKKVVIGEFEAVRRVP